MERPIWRLSLAKMLSGWNAFEISAIQDIQLSRPKTGDQDVTMLHWVENRWMEFLRSTPRIRYSAGAFVCLVTRTGHQVKVIKTATEALCPRRSCASRAEGEFS